MKQNVVHSKFYFVAEGGENVSHNPKKFYSTAVGGSF